MATNTKPQLIILINQDKRERLKTYSLDRKVSMGWLVNELIDRLLSGEVNVMEGQATAYKEPIESISIEAIREMINSSIGQAITPLEQRLTQAEEMANLQIEEIAEVKKPLAIV